MNISAVVLKIGLSYPQWVGVDLDGTLAESGEHHSVFDPIGKPIEKTMERVRELLKSGVRIKIFTGRASIPELIPPVKEWLVENGLGDLEITNEKDMAMEYFFDDRCLQAIPNEGTLVQDLIHIGNV